MYINPKKGGCSKNLDPNPKAHRMDTKVILHFELIRTLQRTRD